MHEMGLAASIFDIVRSHVPAERGPSVRRVFLVVGEHAAVLPESLAFCFDAVVTGTPYSRAALAIERVAGRELKVKELELEEAAAGAD